MAAEPHRFYELGKLMNRAFLDGDHEQARTLAEEYLALALQHQHDWNYGNALHDANEMLGLIALGASDEQEALAYLVKAAQTPGSPQLESYGPSLELARTLFEKGHITAVVEYLGEIRRFWELGRSGIEKWLGEIARGERPMLHRFAGILPPARNSRMKH